MIKKMFVNKMSRIVSIKHNLNRREYSMQMHFFDLRKHFVRLLSKSRNLKDYSDCLLGLWTRQCEFVLAQRIRRGQQMFTLYSKLWEERAFKEILKRMRQQVLRRGRHLMLGAAGLSVYPWQENLIKDAEIFEQYKELDIVKRLRDKQLTCPVCNNRLIIDKPVPKVEYCVCPNQPHSVKQKYNNAPIPKGQWEPFIERKNIIIWRKELHPGKFAYKMLGLYKNICADDYLQVQINLPYRQKWDDSAVELRVIDSHRQSLSDIIYWEMKWPRFFSNRDYVFNRRYYVDKENKIIVLICKSTEHPKCPLKNTTIRVTEYWSILVVKPFTDLNEPGCEFSLTYFDDPGVTLPETMTSWIAVSGMPDFMDRMHKAAKAYKGYIRSFGEPKETPIPGGGRYKLLDEHATSADDEEIELALERTVANLDDERQVVGTPQEVVALVADDSVDDYEQIDPLEPQNYGSSLADSTVDDSFWRPG